MDVVISGASGLIGTALTQSLRADGHRAIALVRREPHPGADEIRWQPKAGEIDVAALEGVDAVVHLAGAGIGDHRWSDDYKRELLESRTVPTLLLAKSLASLQRPPQVLVSASGINFYGDRGDEVLTEDSPPGDQFLSGLCQQWEGATDAAATAGIRTARIRTSIVLTPDGGALSKLLPLFRLGLGGRMGSGRQWWSWISLPDEIAAVRWLIEPTTDVSGPVNLSAPGSVRNAEFAKVLARTLNRPALLPIPAFGPKLLRGSQLAEELLFASQRVSPAVLSSAGFTFQHPELEGALRAVLDRPHDTAA
jgi:uncharacterized protein